MGEFFNPEQPYGDAQNPIQAISEGCPACGGGLVEKDITPIEDAMFKLLGGPAEEYARSLIRVECQDRACRRSWSLQKAQPLVEVH